jgi:hypothetical protein
MGGGTFRRSMQGVKGRGMQGGRWGIQEEHAGCERVGHAGWEVGHPEGACRV